MNKLRVLVLMHEDLIPPDSLDGQPDEEIDRWKNEYDVLVGLDDLGHDAQPLGLSDDLALLRRSLKKTKPHVVFNLLEEFHGQAIYDQYVVSYLELLRQPYTGCNPRGMLLARDKAISKQILAYHRIRTPRFAIFPLKRKVKRPRRLEFPLLVKSAIEDASWGISQASVVETDQDLIDQVAHIHQKTKSDAIAEQFIEGRELYVGVLGNQRLFTFPIWEMLFSKMPIDIHRIATARVKFDRKYQKKYGIQTQAADDFPPAVSDQIAHTCKRIYRALSMTGYARMDLRLTSDGRLYFIEANPNPNLEYGEDFAESAHSGGMNYKTLLQRILNLGRRYQFAWRG